jgi:hypothetical protein
MVGENEGTYRLASNEVKFFPSTRVGVQYNLPTRILYAFCSLSLSGQKQQVSTV